MFKDEPGQIRVNMDASLKAKLKEVVADRKTSQVTLINELVRWYVDQDPMIQAMILGSIPESDQSTIARLILRRMANEGSDIELDEDGYAKIDKTFGIGPLPPEIKRQREQQKKEREGRP